MDKRVAVPSKCNQIITPAILLKLPQKQNWGANSFKNIYFDAIFGNLSAKGSSLVVRWRPTRASEGHKTGRVHEAGGRVHEGFVYTNSFE